MSLARTEANALGHNWVGCEHLLLALLHDQDSEFIAKCADAASLSRPPALNSSESGPRDQPITTVSPYSPRLKRVLEQAERVAALSRSETVEPDHLLAALLAEDHHAAFLIALRNVHQRSP
jgi:ATP-dependent Clp protease ATP-binding subunit ClpA